ncbi:MAG TPA: ATP-binding protein [Candidatus Limnocylindrales bacterium]
MALPGLHAPLPVRAPNVAWRLPSTWPRTASGRVLLAGGVATAAFVLLATWNVGGLGLLWANVHWTLAAIVGTAAIGLSLRGTTGRVRAVRLWAACSIGLWTVGQLVWDVQVAVGFAQSPTPGDLVLMATVLPMTGVLRASIRRHVTRVEEVAVYLDAATVALAIGAIGLVVFGWAMSSPAIGALPSFLGLPQGLALVGLPMMLTAVLGATVIANLTLGQPIALRGGWAIALGLALLWVATLAWLQMVVDGGPSSSSPFNAVFSAGLLVGAYGSSTWATDQEPRRRNARLMRVVRSGLPVAAGGLTTALIVFHAEIVRPELGQPFLVLVGLAIAAALFRQTLMLQDRARSQRELELLNARVQGALDDRAVSEAEHRVRAEQLARVLAASEVLILGAVRAGDDRFERALALVAPDGILACLTRWDPDTSRITWIARHGAAAVAEVAVADSSAFEDLRPEWQIVLTDNRSITYRCDAGPATAEQPAHAASAHLVLPLHDHTGRILGLLHLEDGEEARTIEPTFVDLARLMANQLAIALENARLVDDLQARIAELSRVQTQVIASSKRAAIGELSAAVAHEVNNPLQGILGYAELLLRDARAAGTSLDELEVIRSEALRARTIVQSLMEFARPQAPDRRPTDLTELVSGTLGLMRYHLERGGVTIEETYAPMPLVELDPDAIRQAVLNVINNAVQAISADGGKLTVTTRQEGREAVITVADTGVGMDPATLENAFVPFFTTRDVHEGTGLGLSVTQGIVEAHGGLIALTSESGVGTTVVIRLPLDPPTPSDLPPADGPP